GPRGGFGPGMFLAQRMISDGDKNSDEKLLKEELTAVADKWFDKLDPEKTGKVTQEQFVDHFGELVPPPQGFRQRPPGGGGDRGPGGPAPGGGRGAFGPGRFIGPGFFSAADENKDGTLTRDELKST